MWTLVKLYITLDLFLILVNFPFQLAVIYHLHLRLTYFCTCTLTCLLLLVLKLNPDNFGTIVVLNCLVCFERYFEGRLYIQYVVQIVTSTSIMKYITRSRVLSSKNQVINLQTQGTADIKVFLV